MRVTRVFLPGCFDVIHVGHVRLIREASLIGEVTILLNSDTSVRALKGPTRPIHNEWDRAEVLRAIRYVKRVLTFDEPTPVPLLERHFAAHPSERIILVKGDEYRDKPIAEREIVESFGGEVRLLSMVDGHSTTRIVSR